MSLDWEKGLQALKGGHSRLILDKSALQSCDIDAQFASVEGQSHRWDYLIERTCDASDLRSGAGVEVHPASTGEVSVMIAKKQWAANKCATEEPDLRITKWHWAATQAGVKFTKNTSYARRLAQNGIEFPCKVVTKL